MECSKRTILEVLDQYVHNRQDRLVMTLYLTDRPHSLEALAEECELSVSTVKRIINRNAHIYKHLPGDEMKLN